MSWSKILGTPDCILWSVRFFLTPWERDNTIIRNLVILQSDYMHRVFRLRHLPIAQVASALAFFSFRYWTVFSQSAKAWLRCQLSHLASPSLPQQSMVTHQLVRISWQTPKLILNVQLCAFTDICTRYKNTQIICTPALAHCVEWNNVKTWILQKKCTNECLRTLVQ